MLAIQTHLSRNSSVCGVGCFPAGSLESAPAEMSKGTQRWQLTLALGPSDETVFADLMGF